MVCCIWCVEYGVTYAVLHMVCYTWLTAYGVLHMACCIWYAAYGVLNMVLHMLRYIWCATYGVLHVVSRQTNKNLTQNPAHSTHTPGPTAPQPHMLPAETDIRSKNTT